MSQPLPAHPDLPGDSFSGRWVADVARSVRHPANQFQRAVIDIAVARNSVRMAHGYVDENGRREHGVVRLEVDGREHLSPDGYGVTASWHGPGVLETIGTKAGQEVGRARYEVSADGRTMTITAPEQILVLVRA